MSQTECGRRWGRRSKSEYSRYLRHALQR